MATSYAGGERKLNGKAVKSTQGDLNNVSVMRKTSILAVDPAHAHRDLSVSAEDDDPAVRAAYRPFILDETTRRHDWISQLELSTVTKMAENDLMRTGQRIRVLVLTGSLRKR